MVSSTLTLATSLPLRNRDERKKKGGTETRGKKREEQRREGKKGCHITAFADSNQSCVRAEDTIIMYIINNIILLWCPLRLPWPHHCRCRRHYIQEQRREEKKGRNRDERGKKGHRRVALRPCIYTFTTYYDHSHNVCHHGAVSQPACYKGCCPPDTTRRWTASEEVECKRLAPLATP